MNLKILLIVVLAGLGIASYGALSNQVELEVQKFDLLVMPPMDGIPIEGATELSSMHCSCNNPNNPGQYSPDFCDVSYTVDPNGPDGIPNTEDDVPGVASPTSLGVMGNKLCTWEVSGIEYGALLEQDQGCSANYWLKSSDPTSDDYSWPVEYQPDYLYSDIFNIGLIKDTSNVDKIQNLKDKIENYKTKINDLVEEDKITKQTATSLLWLLDAIPIPNINQLSDAANMKLENFYKRIDLFVERKLLLDIDKKYILEMIDEPEDGPSPQLTLKDALSNSILNPPDDKLAKESVAAILNAAHGSVNYHYSVIDIMQMTQASILNNDQIQTADDFMQHNLAGASPLCP